MNSEGWVVSGWFLLVTAAVWLVFCLVRWRTELRRCQRCGYDLTGTDKGNAPSVCPECGSPPKTGRVRYRTPRRWRRALLALIPALPASQMVCFHLRPDTAWTRWVPTSVLVWSAGEFDFGPCLDRRDAAAWMHVALMRRAPNMWRWQLRAWLGAHVLEALDTSYARVTYRKTWPTGEPVTVFVDPGTTPWLTIQDRFVEQLNVPFGSAQAELVLSLSDESDGSAWNGTRAVRASDRTTERIRWSYAPAQPMARFPQEWFDDAATIGAPGGVVLAVSGNITLPSRPILRDVRWVDTIDDAIDPLTSPALNAVIRQHAPKMPPIQRQGNLAGFNGLDRVISAASIANGWPADVAFTPRYALRFRDRELPLERVAAANDLYADVNGPVRYEFCLLGWHEDPEWADGIARLAEGRALPSDRWSLVIRGDGLEALRRTMAPRYWAGCVELPLGK